MKANQIYKAAFILTIVSIFCSCGKSVKTIDIAELKQIRRSEGAQRVLISNDIRCISADDNNVWIATDTGVSRFERATNSWRHYTKDDGLNSDNVNAVASDGKWVWFGTDDGANRYNVETEKWETFREKDGIKGSRIFRIAVDRDYVWFGTDRGINRYDRNIDSWSSRTESDGLSQGTISAIAVEDEYIWIGTHGQVNRYSRTTDSWNTYSTNDGLVNDFVTTISVTDDYVWFGTYRSGISVYNKTNQTFRKPFTKSDVLSSDDIRSIAIDGNNIWVGTANGGVHRHIETVDIWVRYTEDDGLASNNISWITAYKNEIWLGTYDSGVSMYDKVKNKWITFAKADSPPEDEVKSIAKSASERTWVATASGLMKYTPEIDEWTRYGKKDGLPTDHITALQLDGEKLWVGTARGLASYSEGASRWQFYSSKLPEDFITSLNIMGETLWVGTNNGLFSKGIGEESDFKNWDMGENSHRTINSIIPGKEMIWVGTDNGLWGHDISASAGVMYTTKNGLSHNYISDIVANEEILWLGTRNGLCIHKRGEDRSTVAEGKNVKVLLKDDVNDVIWMGTPNGLGKYDIESGKVEFRDEKYNITSIEHLGDDILWLGTTCGVVEYQISSDSYSEHRTFVTRNPLREDSVANITFDGDEIWFSNWSASHNGAIIKYNRWNNTWRKFTRETILGSTDAKSPTIIKRIHIDDKWVWFATDYGVLRYNKSADTWRHFTTADGLISNNIRQIKSTTNVVWICPEMRTRLSKYDKRDGTWSEIKLARLIHPRNYIYDMEADGDDLWLTISSSGVRKISEDGSQQVYMRDDGLAQMGARYINVDEKYIWVAHWKDRGTGTLSQYDKRTGIWTVYSSSDVLETDMISQIISGEAYTWFIYESWREGSVTGFNRNTEEWTTIKPSGGWASQIREVCEDEGHLWFAPEAGGIKRFHLASGTWTTFYGKKGPSMDFVNKRALKADGKYIWIGTPAGISRYDKDRESWTNYTRHRKLSGEAIQAVSTDDKYVWCGTANGISRYDKIYGTWENLSNSGNPYTGGIGVLSWPEWKLRGNMVADNVKALDGDDRFLWVATTDGAGRYDKVTDRWDAYRHWNGLPGMDVSCVVVDGYDIWMGTEGGIGKFPRMSDDPNAWVSYTSGLEIKAGAMTREYANTLVSNEVWAADSDKDYIWVGTMRGVSRYSKESDMWKTYTTKDGLSSNEISSICVDNGVIWFGSDSGVTMYDQNAGKWATYSVGDGLASDRITCIVKSQDAVWFGTFDSGMMKYDKVNKSWTNYTRENGLRHNRILSASVDGKYIWIGTQRGLSRYDVSTNSWTAFTEYDDPEDELKMVQAEKNNKDDQKIQTVQQPALKIVEINANPPGRDEDNLNGEWVKIVNATGDSVDMTGSTLSDVAGHIYRFGELILPAGSEIRIMTGSGKDSQSNFHWGAKAPIWNNRGDTAYLKNGDGNLLDSYSYGPVK